jgi:hypothetical protein
MLWHMMCPNVKVHVVVEYVGLIWYFLFLMILPLVQ